MASDPTAQRARTEGGRLTSSTATTEESLAPPPDSPTSSSSAQVETASSARAPLSTALATAFEELAPWSLELAPVVLSSPEPFGEAAIEQIVSVESFAAPTNVESLVSNAVETLVQAQLALPGADVDLPVADASVADTRVLNPEPTTLMLLGTGLGLTARYARRRRAVGGVRL